MLLLCVNLTWGPSPDAAGYRIYYGSQSGVYTNSISAASTNAGICGLSSGVTYFFAITASDAAGIESDYSEEFVWPRPVISIQYSVPNVGLAPSVQLRWGTNFPGWTLQISDAVESVLTWVDLAGPQIQGTNFVVTNVNAAAKRFYRLRK